MPPNVVSRRTVELTVVFTNTGADATPVPETGWVVPGTLKY